MNAYGDTLWARSFYTGYYLQMGAEIIQTKDGGYFLNGSCMLKTDSLGNQLWAKALAASNSFTLSSVETAGGDIVSTGQWKMTNPNNYQFMLMKTDSAGNPIFAEIFGDAPAESGYKIQLTSDGGYIIAGQTSAFPNGGSAILIKTDSAGNITWARTYGGPDLDVFNSVIQTSDGGYLAIGTTRVSTITYIFLTKTDANWLVVWAKMYRYGTWMAGYSLCETKDGNFILTGGCYVNEYVALLIKIDSLGGVIWSRYFDPDVSNESSFKYIVPTADSGYAMYGYNESALWNTQPFLFVIKTDSSCNSTCFNPALNLTDSAFTPASSVKSYTPSPVNVINITIPLHCFCDSMSSECSSVGINENHAPLSMEIYPDPFTDKVTVQSSSEELFQILIFDTAARKIFSEEFKSSAILNLESLTDGIYFYRILNRKGAIKNGKIVKCGR